MADFVTYTCEKCGFSPEYTHCDECDGIVVWSTSGRKCTGCGMIIQWTTCRQCMHRQGTPFEDISLRAAATHRVAEESDEAPQVRESYTRSETPRGTSSDGESSEILGKLIGFAVIIAVVLWFVFAVVIPLIVINLAVIFLIAGLRKREWRLALFILSLAGAVRLVADVALGWWTKSLVDNASFLAVLVPLFFYANLVAGLTAAYFLIRDFLNARSPQPAEAGVGEFTRRNMITMGGLLLVGGLTIVFQSRLRRDEAVLLAASTELPVQSDAAHVTRDPDTSTTRFIGSWKLVEGEYHPVSKQIISSYLTVSWTGGTPAAIWTSELDGSVEHKLALAYTGDALVGDYYGGERNVAIKALPNNRLSFSIDPYGEFAPIKNAVYARVQPLPIRSGVESAPAVAPAAAAAAALAAAPAAAAPETFDLTVSGAGNGDGIVTSSPGGLSCAIAAGAGSCTATFSTGSWVIVTAKATGYLNHIFAGWTGPCEGVRPCQLPMTEARHLTATFAIIR